MTRKGQPKVRTGCLTCKSRKVKCDEAKPACVRCTSTGRKCEGYAVVVPSNRAIARARSRTTRLKDALAQARAGWEGGSERATLEYFARDVAPKLPQNLENQFWNVAVPRMSRSEPAIRHAMAAIGNLFPQSSASSSPNGGSGAGGGFNEQADECYGEALRLIARKVAPERDGEDGRARFDGKLANISASVGSLSNRSSPSLSSVGPASAIQSPASLTPGISSIPELVEAAAANGSDGHASTNPFATPPSQGDEAGCDEEPSQHNDVDVVLSCCILFIATEFLRGCLDAAMQHLANGINILNNVEYDELDSTTIDEIVPKFHRLSIIQLCFYDKPGFPSLNLQHGPGPRYNLGPFDKSNSIYLPKRAVDPIILDAIRYIRSAADPGSQTDSRLASKGPVMSEEQKQICASFDRWHAAFLAFVEFPRKRSDQPLPKHQGLICAETEMKYQTAKICISVCRSHDESVYDYFKELFRRIVTLAQLILDSCPDDVAPPPTPPADASYKFDFRVSYLPLLEFVVVKCRWLDIRYEAWLIIWRLATARAESVARDNLHLIGRRMIEREHNVKMDEVTRDNAGLFSLPAEEMRVKDYTVDARFADLVTTAAAAAADRNVDVDGGPAKAQVPYTQRLLLRCGSCELDDLAGWMENRPLPSS
ncbi:C6 finger domain-containing protein [Colletotrichum higginsianum IMI 349063]|uniref:C6 finger domain-containing protein n=2 Tax=Colletotrichum higginsianum TaxID=80884 RepID=A0A1B7YMW5_COLHI|nr:C6 finger domain-containing protein [Colletotrichum higginsianum IMI 349063]OBR13405.1 C6 finger domain-containing protein [Colletotrichum higginsianum IMI 349063]TID01679.1 putative transcriptional regulatory protein C15D4.02 [Colletotrichum higginsianum]GJC95923.1 C6 finger domain-containing protein [Colletotrichum higginsianum]